MVKPQSQIEQYAVYLVDFGSTLGHEIRKTRPAVVISPNEMNKYLATIIIAPLTRTAKPYPTRVKAIFSNQTSWAALDQIRTVDKARLIKKLGKVSYKTVREIKATIKEMLVD